MLTMSQPSDRDSALRSLGSGRPHRGLDPAIDIFLRWFTLLFLALAIEANSCRAR